MKKLTETIIKQRVRSCVTDIDKIVQINLTGRDLEDVSLLRQMTNVEILSLSFNKISSLVDFQYCENLKELYLRRNNIKDLNEIYYLKCLTKLEMLMLSENPCSEDPNYRPTIIKNLRNLANLDGIEITPEERRAAMKSGKEFTRSLEHKKSHVESDTELKKNQEKKKNPEIEAVAKEPIQSVEVDTKKTVSKIMSKNAIQIQNVHSSLYALGASKSSKNVINNESKRCLSRVKDSKMNVCKFCKTQTIDNSMTINLHTLPSRPSQNTNILSATLALIRELDYPSLQIINAEIVSRLSSLDVELLYNKKTQYLDPTELSGLTPFVNEQIG